MKKQFERTARLIGTDGVDCLQQAHVLLFGVGGVGGYVAEALARSGVGAFTLVDNDTVAESNLNRQIIATYDTVGREKTEVMKERILSINPEAKVEVRNCFFLPECADSFDFSNYSYVVDAVDTITAKIEIILRAQAAGVPVLSSMGTGNKLNPAMLEVTDLKQTSVCPLAKVMRRELKRRGVEHVKVVYSKEEALTPIEESDSMTQNTEEQEISEQTAAFVGNTEFVQVGQQEEQKEPVRRKAVPGSLMFVPAAAGILIASEVVKDLLLQKKK